MSNPISIHISISQASGSQFETVEGTWLERRTGEINGREFTGKSQRGGSDADEREEEGEKGGR